MSSPWISRLGRLWGEDTQRDLNVSGENSSLQLLGDSFLEAPTYVQVLILRKLARDRLSFSSFCFASKQILNLILEPVFWRMLIESEGRCISSEDMKEMTLPQLADRYYRRLRPGDYKQQDNGDTVVTCYGVKAGFYLVKTRYRIRSWEMIATKLWKLLLGWCDRFNNIQSTDADGRYSVTDFWTEIEKGDVESEGSIIFGDAWNLYFPYLFPRRTLWDRLFKQDELYIELSGPATVGSLLRIDADSIDWHRVDSDYLSTADDMAKPYLTAVRQQNGEVLNIATAVVKGRQVLGYSSFGAAMWYNVPFNPENTDCKKMSGPHLLLDVCHLEWKTATINTVRKLVLERGANLERLSKQGLYACRISVKSWLDTLSNKKCLPNIITACGLDPSATSDSKNSKNDMMIIGEYREGFRGPQFCFNGTASLSSDLCQDTEFEILCYKEVKNEQQDQIVQTDTCITA